MKFLDTLLASDPSAAFDALSREGQQNTDREQVASLARTVLQQLIEPKNANVQRTYLIHLKGKSADRVICASDLSNPDGWESLRVADIPEQAYVLISADTRNNGLVFTVWLVPEPSGWKVQAFWTSISTLADKRAPQLWHLARAEAEQGHNFNATLLYKAALQLADRGPNVQMGITQSISKDLSNLAVPPDLRGQLPLLWKDRDTTWKILGVAPIAVGGKIYVMIRHEVQPWQTDGQVDGWNKGLLAYFKKRFPEYSAVFSGVVARARESGSNRGYGTVEELTTAK